jgi:hypothetical protein
MAVETEAPLVEGRTGLSREAMMPPWKREPYRLWSLLDLMKIMDLGLLGEILYFCDLNGQFTGMRRVLGGKSPLVTDDETVDSPIYEPDRIASLFVEFGLPRSADIIVEYTRKHPRYAGVPFEDVIAELQRSIERELRANTFLFIEDHRRGLFNGEHSFGDSVIESFPSALFDIQEAGKCLALSRHTACVFHLMRTLEVGLRALGRSLNDSTLDPKINPSWEKILSRCDDEQRLPLAKRSAEWRSDEKFFSAATANLRAVKDAWRNPTMHVEQKYNEEEAREIYSAARGFMRHLATKLSEVSILDPEISA